jgi:hypothetical protein
VRELFKRANALLSSHFSVTWQLAFDRRLDAGLAQHLLAAALTDTVRDPFVLNRRGLPQIFFAPGTLTGHVPYPPQDVIFWLGAIAMP